MEKVWDICGYYLSLWVWQGAILWKLEREDDSFPFVQIFFGIALFVGSGSIGFLCLLRTPGLPGRNFGQTVFPDTLFLSVQIVIQRWKEKQYCQNNEYTVSCQHLFK